MHQPDRNTIDLCPHGRTTGEVCPECDDGVDADWRAVDPRVLLKLSLLFRCPVCGSLVADIDRCRHAEHHRGITSAA